MKKLLSILGAVSLTTTGISGIVANKLYQTNFLKSGWKKILNVRMFHQLTDWYCGAASVQMILNYFNVDPTIFTQDRIYQDLGGVGERGIAPSREIATYLNTVREQHGETRGLNYSFEYLPSGFGTEENEMLMFQDYIVQSLSNNAPIMFVYDSGYERHACVINGIQIDENEPGRTSYNYLEPNFGTRETMTGWDIQNYITNIGTGAALFGVSDNFGFENKTIKIPIIAEAKKEYTKEKQNFNVPVNLTQQTGIINYNQFHNDIATVEFPDWNWTNHWYGHNSEYHDYNFNAEDIPNDNDSWRFRNSYSSHWNEQLWYSPFINNENVFLWDSTKTSYENDENNNFNITFQFKIIISFFSPSLITMADPDMPKEHLDFTTGNTIILKLK